MSKQKIGIALLAVVLLFSFWNAPAQAQGGGWSEPYRLSDDRLASSEGYLVADRYGYVHCFWIETLPQNGGSIIKYARFDGTTWTKPNDIYGTKEDIKNISPFVDQQGILHIAWSEGLYRVTVFYSHAPANETLSAQNWSKPIPIHVPARPVYLRVDSKGVLHILYVNQTQESSGIYYIHSEDKGLTWSDPVWLDPDIRPGFLPDSLNFQLDEHDGLHAVWFYGALERTGRPNWVTYVHSLDGGHTWSAPVTLDQVVAEDNHFLDAASPVMIVQGETVHVIWASGALSYRYHSYSTDGGKTWSPPTQIFPQLQGQAFDGLAVDGAGRVHFFGQVRYPMGIYHAYWDQNRWSNPELVYLIAPEGSDNIGNRVHAHFTLPVVRAGNQLVLTFTDGPADPNRRLFVMYRTLDDIPPLENMPTPSPAVAPVPLESPTPGGLTPMPGPTATLPSLALVDAEPMGQVPAPDLAIRVALVPTLLILGVTMIFQLRNKRRQ